MSRTLNILMMAIALWLPGCATAPPKPNPLKTLAIDECADARQSGSAFNARKSYQLVRYECEQILALDESYRKIDNKKFRKKGRLTYFDEQEYFDEETWFLVTERIRKLLPNLSIARRGSGKGEPVKSTTEYHQRQISLATI